MTILYCWVLVHIECSGTLANEVFYCRHVALAHRLGLRSESIANEEQESVLVFYGLLRYKAQSSASGIKLGVAVDKTLTDLL